MHKIIISNLEIDLSVYKISFNEENSWFSDSFFTKYSYPFDLIVSNEINKILGDILSYDSATGLYYIDVEYVFYDKIEKAVLIVEDVSENVASVSLRYGMEEFPNFDKNLSEFQFPNFEVANIYDYANQIVNQKYPQVNFNFPQIHTEKYNPDDIEFNGFLKIINNRINGDFVKNIVENDIMYNRNIIQPLPYLLYVLKHCFEYSGYELQGDILDDNLLKRLCFFTETDYFGKINSEPLILSLSSFDVTPDDYLHDPSYSLRITSVKNISITQAGKYNVVGEITLTPVGPNGYQVPMHGYLDVKVAGTNITNRIFYNQVSWADQTFFIDLNFDVAPSQTIILEFWIDGIFKENAIWCDLQILPVFYIDPNGRKLTNVLNTNTIDIKKSLPKVLFGNLVNTILNWFNYDVDSVTSNKIVINKIQNSFKENEVIDFRKFENKTLKRSIKQGTNYHYKYAEEGDVDLGGVFMDINGTIITNKDFKRNVENQIQIDCFPLQSTLIDVVDTAKSVGSSDDKLYFVLYNGLINERNTTQNSSELSTSNIFNNYYYDWIYNRINTHRYTLSFVSQIEEIIYLNTKKRPYMFNNIHLIKNITKTQIAKDLFEVELETEILKH